MGKEKKKRTRPKDEVFIGQVQSPLRAFKTYHKNRSGLKMSDVGYCRAHDVGSANFESFSGK